MSKWNDYRRRGGQCLGLGVLAAGLLLASAGLASAAPGGNGKSQRPEMPRLYFPGKSQGEGALKALGRDLSGVAAHYRMTPERLTHILRHDRRAWLDHEGRLFYIDDFPAAPQPAAGAAAAPVVAAALDLNQTFTLHSKPGSKRTIYLDFNGHTTSGTTWNSGANINAEAFDVDGNPAAFNDDEKTRIQKIWQRVAEDYAPFDVDVTTEEPAVDALRRTGAADDSYGARAVITRNTFYNCGCGGVAYVGTFDYYSSTTPDYYQPAWVFFDALGSDEKNIAEAVSHEVGHNLGLSHDGTSTVGYYSGHGNGATGWAPIMGVGYYKELSQWSKGQYPDANNQEDDLAIIPQNGAEVRADDVPDTLAAATQLTGALVSGSISVSQPGIISSPADVDVFRFSSGAGTVKISVSPAELGADLDVAVNLYDANGVLVTTNNPADAINASLNVQVAAGTYYLSIGGSGKGDLTSGYSDYGSLGQYKVTGSYPNNAGPQPPHAVVSAAPQSGTAPLVVNFTGSNSTDADGTITGYAWTFGDGGTASIANPAHTYATAGSYTAQLTVTDSQGLTNSASVGITASAPAPSLHVDNIGITVNSFVGLLYQCVAQVRMKDGNGALLSGVSVSGKWTGVSTGTASATTNSSGVASFNGQWVSAHGTCTFAVTGASRSGYVYAPAQNVETQDSVSY